MVAYAQGHPWAGDKPPSVVVPDGVLACLNGSFDEALVIQKLYYPLMRGLMSLDVNPVPIKSAVALQGHCLPEFRLPLAPLSAANSQRLTELLETYNLLPCPNAD